MVFQTWARTRELPNERLVSEILDDAGLCIIAMSVSALNDPGITTLPVRKAGSEFPKKLSNDCSVGIIGRGVTCLAARASFGDKKRYYSRSSDQQSHVDGYVVCSL